MKNINFYEHINLFLKNKMPKKPSSYLHRHRPTHAVRVSKTYERQVFYINDKVWNEYHIF